MNIKIMYKPISQCRPGKQRGRGRQISCPWGRRGSRFRRIASRHNRSLPYKRTRRFLSSCGREQLSPILVHFHVLHITSPLLLIIPKELQHKQLNLLSILFLHKLLLGLLQINPTIISYPQSNYKSIKLLLSLSQPTKLDANN